MDCGFISYKLEVLTIKAHGQRGISRSEPSDPKPTHQIKSLCCKTGNPPPPSDQRPRARITSTHHEPIQIRRVRINFPTPIIDRLIGIGRSRLPKPLGSRLSNPNRQCPIKRPGDRRLPPSRGAEESPPPRRRSLATG
jgi:hypothetical protein